jgi:peptidoglycan hydrolase-like protein with peptidoglycan-binding domain
MPGKGFILLFFQGFVSIAWKRKEVKMLRLGKRGRKVRWLQRNLKWLAFNPGPVDGIFGSKTRAAVVRFQKWAGLTTNGIVDPKTSTALLSTVKRYQAKLKQLGYLRGLFAVDGKAGPKTVAATRAFQKAQRLLVDGICGPKTRAALENATRARIQPETPRRDSTRKISVPSEKQPAFPRAVRRKIRYSVIHYSASPDVSAKTIDKWHKARGWRGIGYHFVIRKNGVIENGRDLNLIGAHCKGYNRYSIGICLTGSNDEEWFPSKEQLESLALLLQLIKQHFGINVFYLHRELRKTSCPGRLTRGMVLNALHRT